MENQRDSNTKRILKLDEKTVGKIAAGEVVERPAMVIKELVENAIDAGATEIGVEIKKGGKSYLKVMDNGSGIHYDDLPLVFERHATSKIRSIEDLYQTASLGFRGEALASICAVSQIELVTMRAGETWGKKVVAAGGVIHKVSEVGTVQGTTLIIRDLFFNTPARLKFLKSDQAEGRSITELMGVLALSHPEIAFKYTMDERLIFHTQGKGSLANAIFAVFDAQMLKGLYEIKDQQGELKLSGFTSRFDFTKGTKAYQFCFVNGRYVKSDLIKEAVELAYKPHMMNNRFPACVLFLTIPPSEIDVNIHPAKTEIKFHDEGIIKGFIYSALKKAFNLYDQVPKVTFTERDVFSVRSNPSTQPNADEAAEEVERPHTVEAPQSTETAKVMQTPNEHRRFVANEVKTSDEGRVSEKLAYYAQTPKIDLSKVDFSPLTDFAEQIHLESPKALEGSIYDDLRFIGVFDATYLLYEKDHALYLIDQHAAHEKVLYEAFMNAFEQREIQSQLLLLPEIITLSTLEVERLDEVVPLLSEMGFQIEAFGDNSVVIREIPSMFSITIAVDTVKSVIENAKGHIDARVKHEIAEKACKAAIKAKDTMDTTEQMALIQSLKHLNSPYTCPHGRPIIISFSLNELERKFKRIL